ncbi:Aste57867_25524 [Aphanomyces stellatus]|uniref:Aste57867_25524 protein n=1 Tax=Aphanomyces stellatus TaxID=120398 RepID=A0A485LTD4_9STRA|nr:hypothetical protein As57867_025445 [Aphanomyces stellatus]VFU02147.1 Aste57867_25524 [Aphanomyces stellatus]
MGNHSSAINDLPTPQSQLHNPVVLISDCFIHKIPVQLAMQGNDFIDATEKTLFSGLPSSTYWGRDTQYIDSEGQVVANTKAGVVYAGNTHDQPTAIFKSNPVKRKLTINMRNQQKVVVHMSSNRAAMFLEDKNRTKGLTCIAAFEKNSIWSMTLAAGVDVTLGIVVAKFLGENMAAYRWK